MTVNDLITFLQTVPPDTEVMLLDQETSGAEALSMCLVEQVRLMPCWFLPSRYEWRTDKPGHMTRSQAVMKVVLG